MADWRADVRAAFDARAPTYNQNEWHRVCAKHLVDFCGVGPDQVVLDAGTGTGFAAVAAAQAAGPGGRVVGVDLSNAMLDVARRHVPSPRESHIEWVNGDATSLRSLPAASFDVVVCATALLYMPVVAALAEWHRLLRPRGTIAFSATLAGFPVAGRVFRACAATLGVPLSDPNAPLGSEVACHAALRDAGFSHSAVTMVTVPFSNSDIGVAWASNLASPAHAAVLAAGPEFAAALKVAFEGALAREAQRDPESTSMTKVLLARAMR